MASDFVSSIASAAHRVVERLAPANPTSASQSGQRKDLALDGNQKPAPDADPAPAADQLADAVSELNDFVQSVQRDLQFSIDEASGRTIIKVIDSESKEVIRQIPPEEVLNLARNLETAADGTILAVKA